MTQSLHPPFDGKVIGNIPGASTTKIFVLLGRGKSLECRISLGDNKVLKLKDITHKLATST